MTFLVGDNQASRHDRIRSFITSGDPVIAVLLAAVDFEWTVRRAILALGKKPTVIIREKILRHCHGLKAYSDPWRSEIKPKHLVGLADVVGNWDDFKKAYQLRHTLVHGAQGTTGTQYAAIRVDAMLSASKAIATFCTNHGTHLFSRLPVRKRPKSKTQ